MTGAYVGGRCLKQYGLVDIDKDDQACFASIEIKFSVHNNEPPTRNAQYAFGGQQGRGVESDSTFVLHELRCNVDDFVW